MIIELSDDLLDDLSDQDLESIEVICQARRLGHHLLVGSDHLFLGLKKCMDLSKGARGILHKSGNRQRQKLGLIRATTRRVRVSRAGPPVGGDVSDTSVIDVRISDVFDIRTFAPSVVLGENQVDARLMVQMARYYATSKRSHIHQSIKMSCEPTGGGGSTTAITFRNYRDTPRFCICVLDTDRKAPCDGLGQTARRALNEFDSQKPWAVVITLKCREAENTLPTGIIERAVIRDWEKLDRVPDLELLNDSEIGRQVRDYCSLKKGATLDWLLSLSSGPIAEYWNRALPWAKSLPRVREDCVERAQCQRDGECECWLAPKFGEGVLGRCVDVLEEMTPQKVAESVCASTRRHWLSVGGEVFNWVCGTESVRT